MRVLSTLTSSLLGISSALVKFNHMRTLYPPSYKQIFIRLSVTCCVGSFLWVGANFTSYWAYQRQKVEAVQALGQQEAAGAAREINSTLSHDLDLTDRLSTTQIGTVRELLASLSLGKTGYGYLIAQDGTFLYHPLREFIDDQKNLFDLAKELNSEEIREIGERGIRGEKGSLDLVDPITGEPTWIFYHPVPAVDGFFAILVYKNEALPITKSIKRKQLYLSLSLLTFCISLIFIITRVWEIKSSRLWLISSLISLSLAAELSYIWYFSLIEDSYRTAEDIEIDNPVGLKSFLDQYEARNKHLQPNKLLYIPTGIFIRTIKFEESNNVFITGLIWQRYPREGQDKISQGFTLPEAIVATDLGGWEEVYRYQDGEEMVIGWYFEVTLRQGFDYARYPFDSKEIQIRLLPQEISHNVILVPDLDSYINLLPRDRPGLEKDLILPGWNIKRSFFQYKLRSYDTNFGINTYIFQRQVPELCFTVVATRNFLTVFISNFMPILVVSIMMFAIQLIISQKVQEEETRKFTALEIISVGGGLLFIVLLDQLNLRGSIIISSLIYIEYVYFVLYLVIILITLNALLIALGSRIWLISYKDNLIPKLLYWPLLLTLLLLMTIFSFY